MNDIAESVRMGATSTARKEGGGLVGRDSLRIVFNYIPCITLLLPPFSRVLSTYVCKCVCVCRYNYVHVSCVRVCDAVYKVNCFCFRSCSLYVSISCCFLAFPADTIVEVRPAGNRTPVRTHRSTVWSHLTGGFLFSFFIFFFVFPQDNARIVSK